jgi:uncharacterized FlaG/YvyC family protein
MTLQIGRFTPYEPLAERARAGAAAPAQRAQPLTAAAPEPARADEGTIVGAVPPAPTDEARAMVDRAAERVEQLRADNRELHFSRDETSNRVVIEVRDLDGNVIRTIPPAKALEIMSGADL